MLLLNLLGAVSEFKVLSFPNMDGVRITRALCLPFVTRTDTKTWVHSSDAPMASSIRIHRMAARIRIQDCWRVESVLNVMGWVASSPVNALQWAVRQAVLLLMIRSIQAIVRFRLEDMAVLRFKFIKIRPQTQMHNIIYAGVPSNFDSLCQAAMLYWVKITEGGTVVLSACTSTSGA